MMEGTASKERKSYKSSFSIDSLLEKKLGGARRSQSPPDSQPSDSPRIVEKPLALSSSNKPIGHRPQLDSPNAASILRQPPPMPPSFIVPISSAANFASSLPPRWLPSFLHPPPAFAAVAPIWAMAAQAAAASAAAAAGAAGGLMSPFVGAQIAAGIVGASATGGGSGGGGGGGHSSSDSRRTSSLNKAPPIKKYKCDVCSKAFSRSNTLVTHKRIHSGEKPFACEHCGRAFRQPGNLTRHRLTHTTVKPYVCAQCGKAFNRASNLHTHMRTHTDYRPYVCPFCAKAFHQKIDMKIHSYTHTGEKPYRCPTCHKGFTLSSTLNAHRRSHCNASSNALFLENGTGGQNGNNPIDDLSMKKSSTSCLYSCEFCGKDFPQRSSLKNHILASHPRSIL